MASRHKIEDEMEPCHKYGVQPTIEASGGCGYCQGSGTEVEYSDRTGMRAATIQCHACGGDGLSIRETPGAFYRTRPINNCEMGILCLKDSVRLENGKHLKDKDGFAYARGKGTVMSIDDEFCTVYFWLSNKTIICHENDIFKTGR